MIAGLELDTPTEMKLRSAFSGWASHFRSRLQTEGIAFLVASYEKAVKSVETQSCAHGPGGERRTGTAWQACCGISYEYNNDLSVRDALEIVLDAVPAEAVPHLSEQVRALDLRLYALYEHSPPFIGNWWRQGLPRGVLP